MIKKKIYYIMIYIISFIILLLLFVVLANNRPKRSLDNVNSIALTNIEVLLAMINGEKPIERKQILKYCVNDCDYILLKKYNIDSQKIKYSLFGELLRLNNSIFKDIQTKTHIYSVLPFHAKFHDKQYATISAMIIAPRVNAPAALWQQKLFMFPVHLANLKIYITEIRIASKRLTELCGISKDGNFFYTESEKKFLLHMIKIDPILGENHKIAEILKLTTQPSHETLKK